MSALRSSDRRLAYIAKASGTFGKRIRRAGFVTNRRRTGYDALQDGTKTAFRLITLLTLPNVHVADNIMNYRAIWISDLHLGTKHSQVGKLLDFLRARGVRGY